MENILEIKNLDLYFRSEDKEYQALYNVNLSLEKGKIHSIVGESGCGKTMTAMSILRLLPKTAFIKNGEILFNGENLLNYTNTQMRDLRGNKIGNITFYCNWWNRNEWACKIPSRRRSHGHGF